MEQKIEVNTQRFGDNQAHMTSDVTRVLIQFIADKQVLTECSTTLLSYQQGSFVFEVGHVVRCSPLIGLGLRKQQRDNIRSMYEVVGNHTLYYTLFGPFRRRVHCGMPGNKRYTPDKHTTLLKNGLA